jgi:hypothetical protein
MPTFAAPQTLQNHRTTAERTRGKRGSEKGGHANDRTGAGVAQSVEQLICNQQVAGSSPIASSVEQRANDTHKLLGRVPERSKGTDCKSVATGFEGSNPSPSTTGLTAATVGAIEFAGVAQLVELQPSKLDVAGSRPVSRSSVGKVDRTAHLAQLAEHVLGKDEVTRSIRVVGSQLQTQ